MGRRRAQQLGPDYAQEPIISSWIRSLIKNLARIGLASSWAKPGHKSKNQNHNLDHQVKFTFVISLISINYNTFPNVFTVELTYLMIYFIIKNLPKIVYFQNN